MKMIEIWVNCPSAEVAQMVSDALIEERLVACSNLHAEVRSSYRWKGRVEREGEVPLVVKTRASLFDEVAMRIENLHPYETPGIIGTAVECVNRAYLEWVYAETDSAGT
jgi:periplasmic divalent cation tolerance protein